MLWSNSPNKVKSTPFRKRGKHILVKFNLDKTNNYFSHLAYKIGTSTSIANQIANSEYLMGHLLAMQDAEDDSMSPQQIVELFTQEVSGLGDKKAQLLVDSYLELPYIETDSAIERAMIKLIQSLSQDSPQVKWLVSKPSKWGKSPQQVIEENVIGVEGFWDAYMQHKIPYDVAMKGYWLLSEDSNERKEETSRIFTAYKTLDEHEMQHNSPFLDAPNEGFNQELLKELGIMAYTDMGWIKTKTLASIRLIYKMMIEAKENSVDEISQDDYNMFLEQGLEDDQAEASSQILQNKVSFLTGIGGSGKTYMLNKVLQHLHKQYKEENKLKHGETAFYMTAIAGRAVKNFLDSVDKDLDVVGATMAASIFVKARKRQLSEAKVLLIDEISMADINNVSRTIRMAKKAEKIIFIGDVAQLPAIQMDFYSKATKDSVIAPIMLTKPKRQKADSGILSDSLLIRDGKMPLFDKPDSQLGHAQSVEEIVYQNPDARVFLVGTNRTAKTINDIKAKQFMDKALESQKAQVAYDVYADGTRFLVTKNNAETGLMNGEIITLNVENSVSSFTTEDGRKLSTIDEKKHGLKLGFAITIHKSQGSTIDNVVTILDSYNMASRSLLYTAITRASKKHVLYEMQNSILSSAINKLVEYQDYNYQQVLDMNVEGIIEE